MKYLILSFALFVGCSNSTAPEIEEPSVFEPYRIGNWMMVEQGRAVWDGEKTFSAKPMMEYSNDTVYVSSSEDWPAHMEIKAWSEEGLPPVVIISYTDTTVNREDYYGNGSGLEAYVNQERVNSPALSFGGINQGNSPHIDGEFWVYYLNCTSTYNKVNTFYIIYFDPTPPEGAVNGYNVLRDDNIYLTYAIDVNGIEDTIHRLACDG